MGMRWAPFASNDEGDLYWLQCEPDEHGLTPVYFLNHEEASYCIVASDLWHFLWFMLQSVAAGKKLPLDVRTRLCAAARPSPQGV
ncbi:MAG: SMI1/KNR4 family protein [Fimbriimonadales bacterium]|nr:SMI1/KNR4 family protein [Fimbriimonadales bacterium]